MRQGKLSIPLIGIIGILLVGCGQSATAPTVLPVTTQTGYLKASVRWQPNPPKPLKTWNLAVIAATQQGSPLPKTARVQVTIHMTTMDMPPIQDTLDWVSPGHYRGQVIIVMPGTLKLQVTVTMGSHHLKKTWMVTTAE